MDLTTLARLKQYLLGSTAATPADGTYAALIARASDVAMKYTGRTFQRASYSNLRLNGSGSARLMMPQNPIISVSALTIDGTALQASSDGLATGYQYDLKFLYLFGGAVFCRGLRNIGVSFVAGYSTEETAFIPATSPYTITPTSGSGVGPDGSPAQTSGPAVVDQGVVYTGSGADLVAVASAPAAGQYAFSDGVYTFAAADAGAEVTMSYDFVPGAVEQAVIEMVGLKMAQRQTMGLVSKSLADESVTYSNADMSPSSKAMLTPYRFIISP